MDYITTIEMSKIWGISSRRISLLCSQGRVPGAEKKGKTWLIPKDAVKPTDPRKKNRWRIGGYNAYGKTRTLVYFKDKICEIKNKFVKAIFYYITVIMLVLDPIYLCLLSGAFGGGDVNGILYLMPQAWMWTIFAFILLFNIWILLKKVNPTYTASFKERWNKRRRYGIRYH